jgi:hypothetical protein
MNQMSILFSDVQFAISTELHLRSCRCSRCAPWVLSPSTGGNMPPQVMWMCMTPADPAPEGWQRVGSTSTSDLEEMAFSRYAYLT